MCRPLAEGSVPFWPGLAAGAVAAAPAAKPGANIQVECQINEAAFGGPR